MEEFINRDLLLKEIEKINYVDYGSIFSYEAHSAVRDCLRDIIRIIESLPNVPINR